ncbi:MAG: hypothetical protein ONB24_04800 [candidate division KSB1 bacterium]|nr:hypothetical protein [candidate division KSB1 bacterium]
MLYAKMFQPGEVILVHIEEKPAFFAQIERIDPDIKKGWYHLTFVTLTLPMQRMTWILDKDQLRGQPFTMNQIPMQLQKPPYPESPKPSKSKQENRRTGGNVVSLFDE